MFVAVIEGPDDGSLDVVYGPSFQGVIAEAVGLVNVYQVDDPDWVFLDHTDPEVLSAAADEGYEVTVFILADGMSVATRAAQIANPHGECLDVTGTTYTIGAEG